MGPDNRCLGMVQRLTRCLVRSMRKIDEHAKPIHFVDEPQANWTAHMVRDGQEPKLCTITKKAYLRPLCSGVDGADESENALWHVCVNVT